MTPKGLAAMPKKVHFLPMARVVLVAFDGAQGLDILGWGTWAGLSAAAGTSHWMPDSCHSCCDRCHGRRLASDSDPAMLGSNPGPPGLPCTARVKLTGPLAGSPAAGCGSAGELKS
jgi:hypothetical protein